MKKLFLYKLYHFDKKLFLGVTVFVALTALFNLTGDEQTPFFVWGMYSAKEPADNHYNIFRVQLNDSLLVDYTAGYTDNNRFFLSAPLSYYKTMIEEGFQDPTIGFLERKTGGYFKSIKPVASSIMNGKTALQQFPAWYKCYLEQTTGIPIHKLQVNVIRGQFDQSHHVQSDSSYSLFVWTQQ